MENRAKRKPWKTTMPLSHVFGNFIRKTVATAAEETFGVFQEVVDEDEIQRLYQVSWNPKVKLHRLELLQLRVCKKERLLGDQPLVNQDWTSSLKQEEFEHAQIKEEPEELPASELIVKQESSVPEWTPVKEEPHTSEAQSADWHPEESSEESRVNVPVIASVVSLSNCQLQKPTVISGDCQSEAQKGVKQEDSASKDVKRRRRKKQSYRVGNAASSSSTCCKCGKGFEDESSLLTHVLSHNDKSQIVCKADRGPYSPGKRTLDANKQREKANVSPANPLCAHRERRKHASKNGEANRAYHSFLCGEGELKKKKQKRSRLWVHPVLMLREEMGEFHTTIQELKCYPGKFRQHFRMTVGQFEGLLLQLAPRLQKEKTNYREPIDPEQRLVTCLRFLTTGDSFTTIAASFHLGVSTVAQIVRETCDAIWEELRDTHMPRPDGDRWMSVAGRFEERWNFPHCVGALDGKHVLVQAPPNSGSLFSNHEGNFSVVLLALVDADCRFIAVDIGGYGEKSDGAIFANSDLGKALKARQLDFPPPSLLSSAPELGPLPYVTVGDKAFPMKPYLLRPYSGSRFSEDQQVFNNRLTRARRVVENTFAILTQCWRVYAGRLQIGPDTAESVVRATCILHNFLRSAATGGQNADGEAGEKEDEGKGRGGPCILRPLKNPWGNRASEESQNVRNVFCQYFNSPAGQMP